jgi:hypothetical protein
MSRARILDYLDAHPDGATPHQIADAIDGNAESICKTMWRLESRGEAKLISGGRKGLHGVWISVREETPPVFRAMETLRAMQEACRARLTANQMEAA